MPMPITVKREPFSTVGSYTAPTEYAGAAVVFPELPAVCIQFDTNPGGQRRASYRISIHSGRFEELTRLMMKADPQAAIRAFGAAMQDFEYTTEATSAPPVKGAFSIFG